MAVVLIAAIGLALAFAAAQHTIGVSVFEWGTREKVFRHFASCSRIRICSCRDRAMAGTQTGFSTYYLVAPFKFGLDREKLSALDGKTVSLQGTLIYRGNQTMVEALPDSIKAAERATAFAARHGNDRAWPPDARRRNRGQQMFSRRDESRPASAASRVRDPLHQRRHSAGAARAAEGLARRFICCSFPPMASR